MAIVLDGTTGITTPDIDSTVSTLGPLTQALNLGSTGQIVFPATQNASANANTLDDYEEGTWTPTDGSGAGLTFASAEGIYTKIGRQITVWARVQYPSTANGNNSLIGGLPFTSADNQPNRAGGMIGFKTESTLVTILGSNGGTTISPRDSVGGTITNSTMSADIIWIALTYNV